MKIDYDHSIDPQTLAAPTAALAKIFADARPTSLLDIGCGIGTWLKAAADRGVEDIFGIDGIDFPPGQLLIPPQNFACRDLTVPIDLRRRFDMVICLEVGEHLETASSRILIETIARHSDTVIFSAACPGQPGQHHVNCQWPDYWQQLFNSVGFVCEDALRPKLWEVPEIEYWYKQNMFLARRSAQAGKEPRIKAILRPEMQALLAKKPPTFEDHVAQIENGRMPVGWYFTMPVHALLRKVTRRLSSSARNRP